MTNKTWFVTGTSTGFGRSLATYLAQQDDVNVVATARHTDQLGYLDQYNHGQILKATLDVTDHNQIMAAVQLTQAKFGGIDVLVNNAGLGYFGTFEESNLDTARYMFDVNVWGLVDVTRAILPGMRKQNHGTIVNFSSIGGLYSFPTLAFYHGSKYAVEGISETISKEVAAENIKVMLIEPSGFRTDWAGRSSAKDLPQIDDYKQFTDAIKNNADGAHHEPGDPDKAAQIIYNQVTNHFNELPLRLPLGKFASDTAISKYRDQLTKFETLHDLSASADQPE
ncbi:short chain dehydrogenase [Secundilactobacillus odoratitofui DSM 19909 = JCM 15043]|uniref:Short chain dehydrogenase n=1 Tax=Secundilactobacillus odoratitofui DSM 19909 = JCM 15043 TaxID=1423776 RepID=A0A0R1LYM4_9LACO|nr:oxidoreductase [Secundilactobacillus odoratitofui]KRK97562.1 short chain dehydrogenase [Secundilactobacillus odoratitofui DSM 19909 = JCM 15043]